jgi:hypothetical protein
MSPQKYLYAIIIFIYVEKMFTKKNKKKGIQSH